MKNLIYTSFFMLFMLTTTSYAQNVGIGTNAPDASAKLDIESTDKGVLIPRLSLSATNIAAPVAAPATSLLVYNNATAGAGATAVTPGYYYWDGVQWVRLRDTPAQDDWHLIGNAGTNPTTNFIGTTDAVDFVVRTNNTERARITSGGNMGIGVVAPLARLEVDFNNANDFAAIKANGRFGPTRGYLAVQGETGYDGIGSLNNLGQEIGVLGVSVGGSSTDNYGVYGHSNGWGGMFEHENSGNFVEAGGNTYAIRIVDGTEGTGKVLTSIDNNGNAVWANPECGDNQEGFEGGTTGPWSTSAGNWQINSGTTTSGSTGPTAANEGTEYIYCETSGSAAGDVYTLESELETCENPQITFDYHMYFNGAADGTFNLDVSTDGGTTWANLYSVTGDQGTTWTNDQAVNLGAYANQNIIIRFHFTVGSATSSFQYDFALDDINLIDVNVSAGAFAATDDDWLRAGPNFVRTMNDDDSVLVGSGAGPAYPYDFAVDNGLATGTNIGIGSIEYFTDEASETTINNRFSPANDNMYDLGSAALRWGELFAANGVINTSDRRDKENIQSLEYGLKEVMQLNPVTFEWKSELRKADQAGKRKIGLIAQEVLPIFPEVVKTKDLMKVSEDPIKRELKETKRMGLYYSDLIPVLVKAIQEQQTHIQQQQTQIDDLKNEVKQLRKEK